MASLKQSELHILLSGLHMRVDRLHAQVQHGGQPEIAPAGSHRGVQVFIWNFYRKNIFIGMFPGFDARLKTAEKHFSPHMRSASIQGKEISNMKKIIKNTGRVMHAWRYKDSKPWFRDFDFSEILFARVKHFRPQCKHVKRLNAVASNVDFWQRRNLGSTRRRSLLCVRVFPLATQPSRLSIDWRHTRESTQVVNL